MANPNCEMLVDANTDTLLASPAVGEAEGEANPAGSTPATVLIEPALTEIAPRTTQGTQTAGRTQENVTVERALTLPDIPDVDITPLYIPPEGVAVAADIVFIHGLMGSPLNTWLYGKIPNAPALGNGKDKKSLKALVPSFILKKFKGKKGRKQKEAEVSEEGKTGLAQLAQQKRHIATGPLISCPRTSRTFES